MCKSSPLQNVLTANTTAAYATVIPTITEPSGTKVGDAGTTGVFNLTAGRTGHTPKRIHCLFFGAGSDNNQPKCRLYGWSRIGSSPVATLWIPTLIFDLTLTLSAKIGIAGADIVATDRFADTVSVTYQPTTINTITTSGNITDGELKVFSPANDLIAWVEACVHGFEKIQFDFDKGTATNVNAAFRFLE